MKNLLFLLLFCFPFHSHSQIFSPKHSLNLEFLGPGFPGSIKYEGLLIKKGIIRVGVHAGIGFANIFNYEPIPSIILGPSLLLGGKSSFVETNYSVVFDPNELKTSYTPFYHGFSLGYRYQAPWKRWNLRAGGTVLRFSGGLVPENYLIPYLSAGWVIGKPSENKPEKEIRIKKRLETKRKGHILGVYVGINTVLGSGDNALEDWDYDYQYHYNAKEIYPLSFKIKPSFRLSYSKIIRDYLHFRTSLSYYLSSEGYFIRYSIRGPGSHGSTYSGEESTNFFRKSIGLMWGAGPLFIFGNKVKYFVAPSLDLFVAASESYTGLSSNFSGYHEIPNHFDIGFSVETGVKKQVGPGNLSLSLQGRYAINKPLAGSLELSLRFNFIRAWLGYEFIIPSTAGKNSDKK